MRVAIVSLLFVICTDVSSQNYIGMHKDSLALVLKEKENSFRPDNSTVNKVFKYLKYVDRINEQTWLFFLDENDVCTYHKLMSDYLNYQDVVEKLNNTYTVADEKVWEFSDKGNLYNITLTEGDWFFTVMTQEKK